MQREYRPIKVGKEECSRKWQQATEKDCSSQKINSSSLCIPIPRSVLSCPIKNIDFVPEELMIAFLIGPRCRTWKMFFCTCLLDVCNWQVVPAYLVSWLYPYLLPHFSLRDINPHIYFWVPEDVGVSILIELLRAESDCRPYLLVTVLSDYLRTFCLTLWKRKEINPSEYRKKGISVSVWRIIELPIRGRK